MILLEKKLLNNGVFIEVLNSYFYCPVKGQKPRNGTLGDGDMSFL